MNSIYNEIYGLYYYMLEKILEKAAESPVTFREINSIVAQHGFSESNLYFTPDVVAQGTGYNLLEEGPTGYTSILKSKETGYLTNIQKSFIKSMLYDSKIRLFLNEDVVQELNRAFSDIEPLYDPKDFVFTETALDSDNYSAEAYRKNFQLLLSAIRNNNALRICFNTSKGDRKTMKLVPYKLEYGIKDDKFRLCGIRIFHETTTSYVKINLSRILSITVLQQSFTVNFESFIAKKNKALPIDIEVSNIRNGFERIFIALSNYERCSSFDEETGKCTIKIFYTDDDEQELLILLLSFGPAIKVIGPRDFKNKFVERLQKQIPLMSLSDLIKP